MEYSRQILSDLVHVVRRSSAAMQRAMRDKSHKMIGSTTRLPLTLRSAVRTAGPVGALGGPGGSALGGPVGADSLC